MSLAFGTIASHRGLFAGRRGMALPPALSDRDLAALAKARGKRPGFGLDALFRLIGRTVSVAVGRLH